MHGMVKFFRSNPQAFALLLICAILGIGTFVAVLVAIISSGSNATSGEPSGVLLALSALAG